MKSIATLFLALLAAFPAGAELTERQRLEDFDAMWSAIDRGYAYFGAARPEWRRTRDTHRARAGRARTRGELMAALEGAVQGLRDDNVWVSERSPASARRVPGETDLWAAWRGDAAVIEAVRTYGDADVAGLRPGQVVHSIAGKPAALAVRERLAQGESRADARDWALRQALAGPLEGVLRIEVADSRGPKAYDIERTPPHPVNGAPLVARRIGEKRDIGYLRIKAALPEASLAAQFEGAMQYLAATRAMILDLRDVTGPFESTARARAMTLAILAKFATRPGPWQLREVKAGERVADEISPKPGAYGAPLVILVDRWTAGEGEALAAGLRAVAGARTVGTRMAGLRGETREIRLPHSSIVVRFPAEKTFLPDGTPREGLQPDVPVDLAAPQGGPGDPILYQGLRLLEK
jgi:C-terminal processing protease CtpA/Prc